MSEELIPAANGERCCSRFDVGFDSLPLFSLEIAGNSDLLLVLAATKKVNVDLWRQWIANADGHHIGIDAAPPGSLRQRDDVAAVAVDIHRRAVEPANDDFHRTCPF